MGLEDMISNLSPKLIEKYDSLNLNSKVNIPIQSGVGVYKGAGNVINPLTDTLAPVISLHLTDPKEK
tara:strand:- start:335 stop:535 length:201 start_codon:yes stop_codon:yes gene_type:complete